MALNLFEIRKRQQRAMREKVSYSPDAIETQAVASPSPSLHGTKMASLAKAATNNIASEVKRICALPVALMPDKATCEKVSNYYCPTGKYKLWPRQVKAMIEYHEADGLFAPLSVGGGKTLICVLIANDAYTIYDKHKIVHLCPATLVGQLERMLKEQYRDVFNLNVPYYFLSHMNKNQRLALAKAGKRGVYVMSYELLSGQQGAEVLDTIQPDIIIGDEIHSVTGNRYSARGRRFRETVDKYGTQLVGLSGTITKKRVTEYHYLVTRALGEYCFLPRSPIQAEEWSKIIDSDASSIENATPGPITPLIDWCNNNFGTRHKNNLVGFRAAYKQRMATTPGAVSSNFDDEDEIGATLLLQNHKITKSELENSNGWDKMTELLHMIVDLDIAPNGDEITYAMLKWSWRYPLETFGCYNNLFWPAVERIQEKRGITTSEAQSLLDRSREHFDALQDYNRILRRWIKDNGRQGLDSPALIGHNMAHHEDEFVGRALYEAWSQAKSLVFPNMVERDRAFVRVCDFRMQAILRWAQAFKSAKATQNEGAVIWYKNSGVGQWVYETLKTAGLPAIHCKAGEKYARYMQDPKYKGNLIVATIGSHNKGHNSQHFGHCFYAQFPKEAHFAEQSLGRLHRNGQKRDEVVAHVSMNLDFDWAVLSACLNDAAYVHQTTTSRQKLIYSNYSEKPKILPYAVLQEWGAQAKFRTSEMQKTLNKIG